MAPLVPSMISPEFSFVIAFIVGIGFGYALEQAGFSSSRKLVGLFYGYDFTVLKVFFTAGITAMVGVVVLGHLGLLDLSLLYVNPTFLYPALVGGGIMGLGFIMGGFCPGTSICAASVGRLDALAFIGGGMIGIFIFMEAYPIIEPFYTSSAMGPVLINEFFGLSRPAFGILLTVVAVAAFIGTSLIQDKVTGKVPSMKFEAHRVSYSVLGSLPVIFMIFVVIFPSKEERIEQKTEEVHTQQFRAFDVMDADKLAFELSNHAHKFNVIDVRDNKDTLNWIPTALHIPYDQLKNREWERMLKQPYKQNIFVGVSEELAHRAASLAFVLGDDNPALLGISVADFRAKIFNTQRPVNVQHKSEMDVYRFRKQAAERLLKIEERLKNISKPPKKVIKKASGGCA